MTDIHHASPARACGAAVVRRQCGFSLIELMIAMTISLLIVAGLSAMLVSLSSANRELAKANSQIENGRFAIQLLQSDIAHAGFWGTFVPQFDDVNWQFLPNDTPTALPDPCLAYSSANWDFTYKNNLIGIPVQSYDAIPANCATTPTSLANKKANTDVLVVRHAATCVPGDTNCDADTAGKMYFQSSLCSKGVYVIPGTARGGGTNTITLAADASSTNNVYSGMTIHTTGGTGAGQIRVVSSNNGAYNGASKVATLTANWTTVPDNTTTYSIEPTAQAGGTNTITLAANVSALDNAFNASSIDNAYSGMTIRTISGTGAGQSRVISTYIGTSKVATLTANWTTAPDNTTTYSIAEEYVLDYATSTSNPFSLHKRGADCATAAAADKRKFNSSIYYIRDYATTAGDGIPTLMRSSFDPAGAAALAHQTAEALVEGIEGFGVELGIDDTVTRCALNTAVNYAATVNKIDPATCAANTDATLNTLPTNRGDGNPDTFIRCTTAAPCTAAQLANVVAAKLYVLARSTETTPGYTDTKTYCLAAIDATGVCPVANRLGPFNDGYKRHLFSTTVRLNNISGRRETP